MLDPWPPSSPDLNPIENLWAILKAKVIKKGSTTIEELKRHTFEEFEGISSEVIKKLCLSMPTRIQQVLRSRGKITSY